jgi:hypothetical protein
MKKYFAMAISILLVNSILAQNFYTLPENFKSSSISSFENLNGEKGLVGRRLINNDIKII